MMTTKRVAFSTEVTIHTVPRTDNARYGHWIDYCAETKKCKYSADTFVSRRYHLIVICCAECGHVKEHDPAYSEIRR